MHRSILTGVVPVFFALAQTGAAQSPPLVTEAEFLSVLDDAHPAVVERAEALAVARARAREASVVENPVLEALREDPSGAIAQTDWLLSWQLPAFSRGPIVDSRERTADAEASRLAQELLALRLGLREVYAEWALADARQQRLAAQAERVESLARREAARAARGESSQLEVQRLELAASALRSRVALAASDSERARADAGAWNPELPVGARPVLPAPPPPPDPASVHPLVRAAQDELDAATLEREAVGRFVASPELRAGWQRQELGSESLDGPLLGFGWSLPLFDRNQGQRAAADARVAAAGARLELAQRRIDASRPAARSAFERLAAALDDAAAVVTDSERMLDGAETAFQLGESSLTDFLETLREVTEAELTLLDLHAATLRAHRELERLAGATDLPLPTTDPETEETLP